MAPYIVGVPINNSEEVAHSGFRNRSNRATQIHVYHLQRLGCWRKQAGEGLPMHLGHIADRTLDFRDVEVGKGLLKIYKAGVS